MKERVAHTLIGNLQHGLPFGPTGIIAELHRLGRNGAELYFKFVIIEFRRLQADILLPLTEIVGPVVESCNLPHNSFSLKFGDALFLVCAQTFCGIAACECLSEQFALECEAFRLAALKPRMDSPLDQPNGLAR